MSVKNESILESLISDIDKTSQDLRYSAGVQFVYTGFLLNKYMDLMLSIFNLNGSRVRVLFTLIAHSGSLKQKQLARLLFQSKQSISNIVDSMIKSGLVSRQQDTKDRRSYQIVITRKGLDSAKASLPIILKLMNTTMSTVTENDIQIFKASLKAIRKTLYREMEAFTTGKEQI